MARYYAENRAKVKARQSRYRTENRAKVKADNARYRAENAEKVKAIIARYRAENAEKEKSRAARYRAESTEKLKDAYIKHALGIPASEVTPELLELKREQLEIHRLRKQINQAIKEKQND